MDSVMQNTQNLLDSSSTIRRHDTQKYHSS